MQRRHFTALIATATLGAPLLAPFAARAQAQATAQAYPSRPIKIISPFAVGGIADNFSRIIGVQLTRAWGQSVVVENRTGAGGNIGADIVAKSAPDGYTLVMGNNGTHAVNVSLFATMPFDPIRDFTPIARVIEAEGLLVVHPSVPANTVQDLLRLARAEPGKLAYGSGGLGTTSHLAGELFKSQAKVDITHVPYKGNLEAINDLIAGRTQVAFATMPTVLPFVRDSRLRALAVIESQRSRVLPNVPTVAESGVPGFDVKNWIGLFGPAGMPPAITEKLNAEVMRIMASAEVQPQLASAGARFSPNTASEFAQFVQAEIRLWAKVIKDANIRI
jgi:tripartite-type tricarboxylate transporter receptor subunit TctC